MSLHDEETNARKWIFVLLSRFNRGDHYIYSDQRFVHIGSLAFFLNGASFQWYSFKVISKLFQCSPIMLYIIYDTLLTVRFLLVVDICSFL